MPTSIPEPLFAGLPARRAVLMQAALDLFHAHGCDGTSVPAVARRAGMSVGSVYLHFKSKDELVGALIAHLRGFFARRVVAAVRPGDGVRAQFESLWAVMSEHMLHYGKAAAFCDVHHHPAYLPPAAVDAWTRAGKALDGHLRRGRRERVYRDQPEAAMRALVMGPLMMHAKMVTPAERRQSAATLRTMRESVWDNLARPPHAAAKGVSR